MFTNKFDLVVSMGEDCACAMYLRKCSLRDASYPFDWLCHAAFETRIECLKNHFVGFLEKDNMRRLPKPTTGLRDLENDSYEDINTGFYFYHDFKENVPLDMAFSEVKSKYNRRIARLYRNVAKSEKVLFVWWSRDKKIDADTILKSQKILSDSFHKPIYLLIFENNNQIEAPKLSYLSEFVVICKAGLVGGTKTTMGNEKVSLLIFNMIKKKKLMWQKVKFLMWKSIIRILTLFIPVKKWRKDTRNYLRKIVGIL